MNRNGVNSSEEGKTSLEMQGRRKDMEKMLCVNTPEKMAKGGGGQRQRRLAWALYLAATASEWGHWFAGSARALANKENTHKAIRDNMVNPGWGGGKVECRTGMSHNLVCKHTQQCSGKQPCDYQQHRKQKCLSLALGM